MARTPIHPGEHLTEELKDLGLGAAELARQIEVPVNRITEIMNGQRGVTADTAFAFVTGSAPPRNTGSTCKKLYELRSVQAEAGDQLKKLPTRVRRQVDVF